MGNVLFNFDFSKTGCNYENIALQDEEDNRKYPSHISNNNIPV